jgi:conjugative transposon TraN protein
LKILVNNFSINRAYPPSPPLEGFGEAHQKQITMKRIFIILAFLAGTFAVCAQDQTNGSNVKTMPSTGDYFHGLTRPLTFDKMIAPYALEVTFSKTVHIIFPAAIRYVDLGSADLMAAKADGTENVLRVKAAQRNFSGESNLSVITDDGSYYSFNVKYADEPVKLSVEMADFIHSQETENSRGNTTDIYLDELGGESPLLVNRIMQSIYKNDRREIKHISCKQFGMQYTLKGIYSHNNLMYFHTELKNSSNVPFNVDYISFRTVDKKVAKRTAIQQQSIVPLRAYNQLMVIGGKKTERTVFALHRFTLPEGKQLLIELNEKDGGRGQSFTVKNDDLLRAKGIGKLRVN